MGYLTPYHIDVGGTFHNLVIEQNLAHQHIWSFIYVLVELVHILTAGNLEGVLNEQSSWLVENLGKDDQVKNIENILNQNLGPH